MASISLRGGCHPKRENDSIAHQYTLLIKHYCREIFARPLSDNQTINFSYITLSAKEPSEYHMEKQELSFQFASVLDAKQQTGQ